MTSYCQYLDGEHLSSSMYCSIFQASKTQILLYRKGMESRFIQNKKYSVDLNLSYPPTNDLLHLNDNHLKSMPESTNQKSHSGQMNQ